MSERREKKRRYNLRLQYISEFAAWLEREPPIWRFWKWRKWKFARPVWNNGKQHFSYKFWEDFGY